MIRPYPGKRLAPRQAPASCTASTGLPSSRHCNPGRLAILVILGMALLTACGRQESNVETSRHDGILHFGNGEEPQDLDPHTVAGVPEYHVLMSLFEGLVTKDAHTLEPRPGVARHWEVSADGRTWTFQLRENARWSDGSSLTAGDFMRSWQRALSAEIGNPNAELMFVIKGARDFHSGKDPDFTHVGIRATGTHTLEITLAAPAPYFLQLLDHHTFYPVPMAILERFGGHDRRGTPWTRPGNFVGNGAFRLVDWRMQRDILVRRNDYYWDAARVRLNGIRFYPVSVASTEERMYRAGQLHVTDRVPAHKIAVYRENDPASLRSAPFLGTYFYRFNVHAPPLDDARIRLALALAVDRDRIVDNITLGGQQPATSLTPPGIPGYQPPPGPGHDPARARGLLAAAGYPDGRGFPELELQFNSDELHRRIATAIQAMWRQELGIHLVLTSQDWKVQQGRERSLAYQVSRGSWIGDYMDPTTFLDVFRAGSGNNRTGWKNPAYDALLEAAARTQEAGLRNQLLRDAEEILIGDMPFLPIFTYSQVRLVSPLLCGWHANALDQRPWKSLWIDQSGRGCS